MDLRDELMTWGWGRVLQSKRNWLRLPELGTGLGSTVDYLAKAVRRDDVLLHGSNARTIEVFEPREQTTYHGTSVTAVFATPDPVWPLFFAVTDTRKVRSRWNACLLPRVPGGRTRYFFSVGSADCDYWTNGAVYLLPRSGFRPSDEPSEWVSTTPVTPLAVVPVRPEDFPFRDLVFPHAVNEPEWRRTARLVAEALRARSRRRRTTDD